MKTEKLTFPIIAFSEPSILEVFIDECELTSCRSLALKNGYFDGLNLVDSNGVLFIVSGAEKIGTVGPFWGFNIFLAQQIRVDLKINEKPLKISLDEMKQKVLKVFRADEYLWNSAGDLVKIKNEINKSESFVEVINILLKCTRRLSDIGQT